MKNLRIAILCEKLSTRGGLERYVLEFARRIHALGASIDFVTSTVDPGIETDSITIRQLPRGRVPSFRLLTFNRLCASAVRTAGYDLVLGFGQTTHQDIHRAGGGCHSVYSRLLHPAKRFGIKNLVQLALEKELYLGRGTREFVVNSHMVRRQILETYAIEPERVTVIHTAVDTTHFKPAQTSEFRNIIRMRHGIPLDEPLFLFVSLNHKRKGLAPLLRAWRDVPGWLLILGAPLETSHHRFLRSSRVARRIVYGGNTQDLAHYYNAADFFVHPTLYDACANTVLQAMASGLVTIVSSKDGATDHIEEGVTGFQLINPTDPDEIAATCRRIASFSSEDRARVAQSARERMLTLTWEKHLDEWERLIRKVRSQ